MHDDLKTSETNTTSESSKPKFLVSFILVLFCAVAIGFGIRHYRSSAEPITEAAWEVYFSEVEAGPNHYSLEKRLVAKLTDAAERIDAALYHLNSVSVADALIEAHNRGVQVRMVTETANIDEAEIGRLQEVGIPVADDRDLDSLMHHKFIVIDEQYVWTGSYNTTYNGAYKNNNNVILIASKQLAENFTQEFEEMFLHRKFGKEADEGILHRQVKLGDATQIFTYFAPEDNTISLLEQEIQTAKKSIHFMVFSFTHDKIGKAMLKRFKEGVKVQGVFEPGGINSAYSEYTNMEREMQNGGDSWVKKDEKNVKGKLHHKVIIIDEEIVITGSYNFSKNAETRNNENLLIIKGNQEIAEAYLTEFERITR